MARLPVRWTTLGMLAPVAALIAVFASEPAVSRLAANHGSFTMSTGIYRIPYTDGTDVTVSNDHHTHNPVNRIDMSAGTGTPIVAAASGIIRAVVDIHGNSPGAGNGVDKNGNPQDDSLEHSCQDGSPAVENSVVVGFCSDYNNSVWIEHPNGEWTKYSHFGTGTVTANNWVVGAFVQAGQVLGLEGDVGRASGPHLHFEVGWPTDPTSLTPFSQNGGFLVGVNRVPTVCDIANNLYVQSSSYTANPCNHQPPQAEAGGPYFVNEGATVALDGTASNDPEGNQLTYLWNPPTNLDDASLAQPTYSGIDDAVDAVTLTVFDQIEALSSTDTTSVTVLNVPPAVTAFGAVINEGGIATVSASVFDPGTLDTHTATVSWGDGTPPEPVTIAQLAVGRSHTYGDNGVFPVLVTVADDDGGVGNDAVLVTVNNLAPSVTIDVSDAVNFPGGDYLVVQAGSELPSAAQASDPGSDDLTFTWNVGDVNTYFNDGIGPDPAMSPFGTFPFAAMDGAVALYQTPGVEQLAVTVTDDDGGAAGDEGNVVVVGLADTTQGSGWWKHQYSGNGAPHVHAATLEGYLAIVNAVSSVFSESVNVASAEDVHALLSPSGGDRLARARAELMVAWLQFASGAVAWDASVPVGNDVTMPFLDVMFEAETTILDATATDGALHAIEQLLAKVRHAH